MESIEPSEFSGSCTAIRINSTDTMCVLNDSDSTYGMLDFAVMGGFLKQPGCVIAVPEQDEDGNGDGLCYHTSSALAFTS